MVGRRIIQARDLERFYHGPLCEKGMFMSTDEKIIALVKPEYMEKIPAMFRKHAMEGTCGLIAREHPDLYAAFEGEPSAAETEEMTKLVNGIFEQRMEKHHFL